MFFLNQRIGVRLGASFALILFLLAVVAGQGLYSMGQISARLDDIVRDKNVKVAAANEMQAVLRTLATHISNIVLLVDDDAVRAELARMTAARVRYAAAKDRLSQTGIDASEAKIVANLGALMSAGIPLNNRVIELRMANRIDEATTVLMDQAGPALRQSLNVLEQLIRHEQALVASAARDAHEEYTDARTFMIALGALAIIFGSAIAWLITRSITRPIDAAVKLAETVAAGDISSAIEITGADETGRLLRALKDMNDGLVQIVWQVRSGTETIAMASAEIAGGNMDLATRTESQAAELEQTASSLQLLTSTVRRNAGNAGAANQLALTASEVAARGGAVVAQVVHTMAAIDSSSRKIVDIIAVIDNIAFQTNILALNAAVEAARAGDHGRGFAVVAAEVRNLAQRSAAAAREVKSLIGASVDEVYAGNALVTQAGDTMREVVDSVRRVTDIMAEISAASQEQSAGIEQVDRAVGALDASTTQNAALVEQAAAAASSLQEQAAQLKGLVSLFRLPERAAGAPALREQAVRSGRGMLEQQGT